MIDSLGTLPWAVVTSGTTALAGARLDAAGIARPAEVLITADLVTRGKPDPEGYRMAVHRLAVDAAQAVVFEDALAGIRAARGAGIGTVVGVGGRDLAGEADLLVQTLEQVTWTGSQLEIRPTEG